MKISWINIPDRIKCELRQLQEEGINVDEFLAEWDEIEKSGLNENGLNIPIELFYQKIETIPSSANEDKSNPSTWGEYVEKYIIKEKNIFQFHIAGIEDRILGGWLGRSAGCLLGKPIEKTPRPGIKELLSSNGTWPVTDYITGIGIPDNLLQKYPWNKHDGRESLKENIVCMNEDDDMNYPMINLFVYERFGKGFTTENIIQTWLEMLPVLQTFTAERVAYINTLNGFRPPETALVKNPYREWIGAQIRADIWGWVSAGNPMQAAEFAWRDARLSHVGNGIYGEIFIASAIAAAFKYNDIKEIINEALTFIPGDSRLAEAIRFVMSLPISDQSWDETVDTLYEKYGQYHWVHTINNAALVTAALISSNGDFETAVCNTVMGGWDTDSNGATVGAIMGTMLGAEKLPSKWIDPLNNKIRSSLKGFDNALLSELAKRTTNLTI